MPDDGLNINDLLSAYLGANPSMGPGAVASAIRRRQGIGMLGMASGDPAMANTGKELAETGQHGVQFGLQAGHLQQQNSILQNTMQHQRNLERMEQEKIDQGRYSPVKDMFGRTTGLLEGKTGRVIQLPGAVAGPAGALTPEARDMMAQQGLTSGQVPRMPGRAGAATSMDVANRMAELGGGGADLAGAKAGYGADTASLKNLTKQSDAMNAFEGTALKNLDQFLGVAHSVVDTGSPLFNAPARAFMQSVAGDPKMAQFAAARNVAVQEISKVLGGSLGGSAVSDSARHEASGMIGPDMSLAQIEAVAKILKTDMANRRASLTEQIGAVRGRTGGKAAPAPAEASVATVAKKKVYNPSTGQIEER